MNITPASLPASPPALAPAPPAAGPAAPGSSFHTALDHSLQNGSPAPPKPANAGAAAKSPTSQSAKKADKDQNSAAPATSNLPLLAVVLPPSPPLPTAPALLALQATQVSPPQLQNQSSQPSSERQQPTDSLRPQAASTTLGASLPQILAPVPSPSPTLNLTPQSTAAPVSNKDSSQSTLQGAAKLEGPATAPPAALASLSSLSPQAVPVPLPAAAPPAAAQPVSAPQAAVAQPSASTAPALQFNPTPPSTQSAPSAKNALKLSLASSPFSPASAASSQAPVAGTTLSAPSNPAFASGPAPASSKHDLLDKTADSTASTSSSSQAIAAVAPAASASQPTAADGSYASALAAPAPLSHAGAPIAAAPPATLGAAPAPQQSAPPVLPALNTAQVLQTIHGTELRLGLHSSDFGAISIATTVSPAGLSAQISLDHAGLGAALASHLPSLEEKLGASLGLPARFELRDAAPNFQPPAHSQSQTGSSGSQPDSSANRQSQHLASSGSGLGGSLASVRPSAAAPLANLSSGRYERLSVHA